MYILKIIRVSKSRGLTFSKGAVHPTTIGEGFILQIYIIEPLYIRVHSILNLWLAMHFGCLTV